MILPPWLITLHAALTLFWRTLRHGGEFDTDPKLQWMQVVVAALLKL